MTTPRAKKRDGTGPWRLFHVVTGSPAYEAGLRGGDVLTSARKRRAKAGDDVDSASDAVSDEVEAAEAEGRPAVFTYHRGGKERIASFLPARTCAVPVVLDFDDVVNAYYQRAGGEDDGRVVVHLGMLRVASNDDMLAAAIGHELAHSLQNGPRHEIGLAGKAIAHGVLSIVGLTWPDERTAWARDDEREADVVGLRLATLAGFDPLKGAEIYGRLASATDPMDLAGEGNHPAAVERDVYARREAEALARKLRRGESIDPGIRPAA